jgi:hypothetical protein
MLQGVRQQKLQLSHLVAAIGAAAQVIPLDIQVVSLQAAGETGKPLHRRWEFSE